MNLMTQRDTIAGYEAKLVPILATAWLALQVQLTEGFCFYQVTFKYTQYADDSAFLIDMCSLKAFEALLEASQDAAAVLIDPVPEEEGAEGETGAGLFVAPSGTDYMNSIVNNQKEKMKNYE